MARAPIPESAVAQILPLATTIHKRTTKTSPVSIPVVWMAARVTIIQLPVVMTEAALTLVALIHRR